MNLISIFGLHVFLFISTLTVAVILVTALRMSRQRRSKMPLPTSGLRSAIPSINISHMVADVDSESGIDSPHGLPCMPGRTTPATKLRGLLSGVSSATQNPIRS